MPFILVMAFYLRTYASAERCEEEGIIFVGPKTHHLDTFGDKIKAKEAAAAGGDCFDSRPRRGASSSGGKRS
ncbi:hypothetical protein ODV97_19450 [Enterococcus gallinarum]|nr:hypothetical protein [Enterococcus gallinarum]